MLTNATSEQQAATQDSNCIIEHKALARRPQVSDINKELTFKVKDQDKDQTLKAKDQDKD